AVLLERGVHFRERRLLHVDFTTHFEHGGRAFDRVWDVRDGAEVRSDVLALTAVAARGALHELAILVAERGRETVDLWLCGDDRRAIRIEDTLHLGGEGVRVYSIGRVVERQHRHAVPHFAELLSRRTADFRRRAILTQQLRKAGFDRCIAHAELVV